MWLYIWVVSHKFSTGYSFGGWEKWVNISKSNRYNSCVYMRVTDGYLVWVLKLVYATPPRISIHRSSQCGKPMLSNILTVYSIDHSDPFKIAVFPMIYPWESCHARACRAIDSEPWLDLFLISCGAAATWETLFLPGGRVFNWQMRRFFGTSKRLPRNKFTFASWVSEG